MFRSIRVYFVTNKDAKHITKIFTDYANNTITDDQFDELDTLLKSVQAIEIERLDSENEEEKDEVT